MVASEIKAFLDLLRKWEKEDFGSMDEFHTGGWSRRNLAAMIEDVEHLVEIDNSIAAQR